MVDVTESKEVKTIHEEDDLVENQEQEDKDTQDKQISKRKTKDLLDLQMHLQLVNEAQSLVDVDLMDETYSKEEDDIEWDHVRNMDI
jgi:hypothetical protein